MKIVFLKKSFLYLFVWSLVFIGLPIIMLYFTSLINDFGWYLVYFILLLPLIFISFLVVFITKNKNKNILYKTDLILFCIFFVIEYVVLLFWLYYGLREAFGGMTW